MSCSHTSNCQLYPQFAADPGLKLWQQHYCEADYANCARYQVALTGKPIPLTLLPNGKLLHRYQKRDELAANALFNAIMKNRIPVVKSLLNGKIQSGTIQMADGTTPLMMAVEKVNLPIVKLLLEAGCSPTHRNNAGDSALDIAIRNGFDEGAELIRTHSEKKNDAASGHPNELSDSSIISDMLSFLRKLKPAR